MEIRQHREWAAARSAARSKMGATCPRRGRDGWVGPPGADWYASVYGTSSSILASFSGSGGWDKEKELQRNETRWKNGRTGGSTEEENEHVPPIRSRKDHALCLRSCLTSAETGQQSNKLANVFVTNTNGPKPGRFSRTPTSSHRRQNQIL